MKLKRLFPRGTGGEIDNTDLTFGLRSIYKEENRKIIEWLRKLGEECEPPPEVVERVKTMGKERFLAEAAKMRAERETG